MNYQRIYDQLIARAVKRCSIDGYTEKHHIIPRSIGGGDEAANIALLTLREHYIAHWLLWRIHRFTQYGLRMAKAFNAMNSTRGPNREQYVCFYGKKEGVRAQQDSHKYHKEIKKTLEGAKAIEADPLWEHRIEIFNYCYNKGGPPNGAYNRIVATYYDSWEFPNWETINNWEFVRAVYIRLRRSVIAKAKRYNIDFVNFETYEDFMGAIARKI